jgi:hypothetical protein
VQDHDLNAALNLDQLAQRLARHEGLECYVAATGAETQNARRGRIRLDPIEHGPAQREESSDSTQHGDVLALEA